jgi:digeranylgeranylglycerophospholipid reductase
VTVETDVAVIGAGPCGSLAALTAAKKGAEVTLFEEHSKVGVPSHCAGHLSLNGLRRLGLTLPSSVVENTFKSAVFVSPSGKQFSVSFLSPVTCAVNRELFDQHLAKMASAAGVRYSLSSRVGALIREKTTIKGVVIGEQDEMEKISSKIVIDAEGIASRILKDTELRPLNSKMLVKAVSADVDDIKDVENDRVEVYLGNRVASGFYAWLIPKKDGTAKIGLATNHGNPKQCLEQFVNNHKASRAKFRRSKILHLIYHTIPLGGPISKTYADGFLAVGDVASQVKPTTGGGVITGLTCARIAGEVAGQTIREGNYSVNFLKQYEINWVHELGFDMKAMLFARKLLNRLSDREIDRLFSAAIKSRLEKALFHVKNLDLQGKEATRLAMRPSALFTLAFFFFSAFT